MHFLIMLLLLVPGLAVAEIMPRDGWRVIETEMSHPELTQRLLAAVPEEGLNVVTGTSLSN